MEKLKIKPKHEIRLVNAHPWIFSNEIENFSDIKTLEKGSLVEVDIRNGEAFAIAYFNPHSLIAGRILTYNLKEKIDEDFFVRRISNALKLREKFFDKPFYRLIHSESDLLPGLIIDRFDDVFSCQISTAGMEKFSEILISAITKLFPNSSIIFRNDVESRKMEGLELYVKVMKGEIPSEIEIEENEIKFSIDLQSGQKTGWFFDQRENRKFISSISKDCDVLDAFCYLGGFGMNALKGGAKSVTFVDSSEKTLENLKHKTENLPNVKIIKDKVFDLFAKEDFKNNQFDVVVLDPPAFVKSKKDFFVAIKGYEKLVKLALPLLKPNGILMLNSCSHHVSLADLIATANNAFRKSRVVAKLFRVSGAGFDHPLHSAVKESEYLKSISFFVE